MDPSLVQTSPSGHIVSGGFDAFIPKELVPNPFHLWGIRAPNLGKSARKAWYFGQLPSKNSSRPRRVDPDLLHVVDLCHMGLKLGFPGRVSCGYLRHFFLWKSQNGRRLSQSCQPRFRCDKSAHHLSKKISQLQDLRYFPWHFPWMVISCKM